MNNRSSRNRSRKSRCNFSLNGFRIGPYTFCDIGFFAFFAFFKGKLI